MPVRPLAEIPTILNDDFCGLSLFIVANAKIFSELYKTASFQVSYNTTIHY
jgi:hypothetical protein